MLLENLYMVMEYEADCVLDLKIAFVFTNKVEKLWQSVVISLVVGIDLVGTR